MSACFFARLPQLEQAGRPALFLRREIGYNAAMNQVIQEKLKLLPDAPGVYRMYDAAGQVIYVGKAVNLKNRVRQYFQNGPKPPKVAAMVAHIQDFEYILTANETEALTLESNLIKSLQPRYNVLLKDDKHFPYVRLDIRQDFPRFEVVRKIQKDGARYFGPYLSALSLRDALNMIRDSFPVRHCKKDIHKAIARGERPCLMYHLGKCCAPCSGKVSRAEYHALLESVCRFLEGHTQPIIEKLTQDMVRASEAMEFERAAQIRDQIQAVRSLGEKQQAISTAGAMRDVFALARDDLDAVVFALFVRGGKIVGTERLRMACGQESGPEVMGEFLKQYYAEGVPIPPEIVVHELPEDAAAIEAWLTEKRGHKAALICPQRGEKRKQADMAYQNGMDAIEKARELEHRAWEKGEGALAVLERFGLDIPAIGLAERSETILLPGNPEPLVLSRRDPALHLLQRIRDEAHRFAITYHRSLRGKNALMSQLDQIQGIGPKRKRALFNHFLTLDAIKQADVETLRQAPGMNLPAAEQVYRHFHMENSSDA